MKNNILQSLLVALVISLLFPALWFGVLGETSRSPVIEKTFTDNMSTEEYDKWFSENSKTVDFFEHIQNLPFFISNNWRGYLQASVAIFVIIFSFNYSYLVLRGKNKP